MEYIDIVDEQGNKTGEVRPRDEVHKLGLLFRSAHIWCVNSKNEILLQKRGPQKKNFPNKWDISVCGLVSSGEEPIDTAKKEVREEIGLNVTDSDLEFLTTNRQHLVYEGHIDNGLCSVYLLRTDLSINEFVMEEDQVVGLKWVPFVEFKKMVDEKNSDLVPHWEEYNFLLNKLK